MKNLLHSIGYTLTALLILFSGCNNSPERIKVDPAFGAYISAYTSGVISRYDPITIKLSTPIKQITDPTEPIEESLFDFQPSVDGKAYWIDNTTLQFIPEEPLKEGTLYTASLKLDQLVTVKKGFEVFKFQFQTLQQAIDLYLDGFSSESDSQLENQVLKGKIVTAERIDTAEVYKMLRIVQRGEEKLFKLHRLTDKSIAFTATGIQRSNEIETIEVHINGNEIGVDEVIHKTLELPALGDFKVVQVQVIQQPKQYVEVRFSDPLKKQNLEGLVTIEDAENLDFIVDKNVVNVYTKKRLSGQKQVLVAAGIKNIQGYKMQADYQKVLQFEQLKPTVNLIGEGVILPNSNGLVIPFEAVNLRYVDLFVRQIYEDNVLQFLQQNQLDGNYRLTQVGRIVHYEQLDLSTFGKADLKSRNRFHLDLSKVITTQPGAIYRIELKFKKDYSLYNCGGSETDQTLNQLAVGTDNNWDGMPDYPEYNHQYYNWRDRDDPCKEAYYSPNYNNAEDSKNVIASNLGLLAKIGSDRKVHVAVNNLITAEPMAGVEVTFYDYQQQVIDRINTNQEGLASISLDRKPGFAIARDQNQYAYLKLDDGSSLSMSKFDVSGDRVERGIKGFLYGERGVWRPGDSLYLTFILEDKANVMPDGHPIIFELTDPRGKTVQRKVAVDHVNGFYNFKTATDAEAPTGYYTARVKVGNRTFTKSIRIETVKPNRLKIYLDFGGETIYANETINGDLKVKWLHGANAGDLKAKVDMTLGAGNTVFEGYTQYTFDDPSKAFNAQTTALFENTLNAQGEASLNPEISAASAPGMIRMSFNTKVFEPGGGFSVDRYSVTYSPFTHYAGINVPQGTLYGNTLITDETHEIDVITLDQKGKSASKRSLELEVYKMEWRWWWDSYQENIGNYIARNSVTPIDRQRLTSDAEGKATYNFRINRPEWGRYLIRVTDKESGHSTGKIVYVDWPYWARSNRKNPQNATMLGFSTDKDHYQVGESVKVNFPSAEGGQALVSIENGTAVLESFWVPTEKGETTVDFIANESMTPNVYIHITLLQPHAKTENDHPIRMYGVVPVRVENNATHLFPEIQTPDVFRPETNPTIKVSERNGNPMTYTIAVVDEGLLDLTRFKTPDPWSHFYAREALGVKTWDLYDYVIGAFGGRLDKLMAVGGDGMAKDSKDRKANRFEPMVRFLGPFKTNGKTKEHQIEVPNYVGSVRVMVVAGDNGAYGSDEQTVPVRNPLMVLATLPRVLSPGETVDLPVNVFAMEDHVQRVKVKLQTNRAFEVLGASEQQLRFDQPGDEVITFKLKVQEKIGLGEVVVRAESGSERAEDRIELDVRAPNPVITEVIDTLIAPGATVPMHLRAVGMKGTNAYAVELSSFPALGLEQRLNYLLRYPHGCIEQTTSAVFPQLYLQNVMKVSDEQRAKSNENVRSALNKLVNFQTTDGGFAYWPGRTENDFWGTNYAGHFMLEAENNGFALPIGVKNAWLSFQKSQARYWSQNPAQPTRSGELIQAYRLYTLALANEPELGAMNRLKEQPNLSPIATWRLGAAYALAGQKSAAKQLISELPNRIKSGEASHATYGSALRDEAMILETMVLLDQRNEAIALLKHLVESMNARSWLSTQTTAYCLNAVAQFLGNQTTENTINITYQWPAGKGEYNGKEPVIILESTDDVVQNGDELSVTNKGSQEVFVRITRQGIPLKDERTAKEEGLQFEVDYLDLNGQVLNVDELEQGTDFIAKVTVAHSGTRGDYNELALTQLFPSGWEIINSRMEEGPNTMVVSVPEYQDIRDDRVYTYFDLPRYKKKTFIIQLNATYAGEFYLPVVACEAMYDQTIQARTNGKWVSVVSAE